MPPTAKKPAKQSREPQVFKALAHPLRMKLLVAMSEREASPSELATELGEPLGNVAYHVRMLERLDCIELVRTTPRRGALEHHYRADRPPGTRGGGLGAGARVGAPLDLLGAHLGDVWQDLAAALAQRPLRRPHRPASRLDQPHARRARLGRAERGAARARASARWRSRQRSAAAASRQAMPKP